MEKKDYNDNYSRVRHSNAKNRTTLFCHLRIAESFRLVRESSAAKKISPASSLYENRKLPVRQTGIPPLKGSLFV